MKKIKKLLSLLIAVILVFGTNITIFAAPAVGTTCYVDTHVACKNSATGTTYRAVNSIDYMTVKNDGGVCYCIEPGKTFTRTFYSASKPTENATWLSLSASVRENVALTTMFGFPTRSAAEMGAPTDHDAYAATQAIIWEYITGERTNATQPAGSRGRGVIGTPAERAYWNILSQINTYQTDSRYVANAELNSSLCVLTSASTSTEQGIVIYSGAKPVYPELPKGKIEIYKTDEDGDRLSGAYFKITNTATGDTNYLITDRNGYAVAEPLDLGAYTVTETSFPSGYEAGNNQTQWTVTLSDSTPNYTVTINAVNSAIPPVLKTTALYNTGVKSATPSNSTIVIDKVNCKNLIVGKDYTVYGKLVDRGNPAVVYDEGQTYFVATATEMNINVEFNFDTSSLAGKTFVVFEDIYHNGRHLATHSDITDLDQTVTVPYIDTAASNKEDGTKLLLASGTQTIVDTVTYTNLYPYRTYTAKAQLYNAETGEVLKDKNGNVIIGETVFTPTTTNGAVNVEINFDAEQHNGTKIVVFEDIYDSNIKVAFHNDLTDEEQSVYVPKIHTSAVNKKDDSKLIFAVGKQTIVDTVSYNALQPQREYKAVAQLYNAETGEVIKDKDDNVITGETVFTPENLSGSVQVEIDFDGALLEGVKAVVFEKIYNDGKLVATHCNLRDEKQSVYVPKIRTVATDKKDGTKLIFAGGKQTVVDTVSYNALQPKKKYTAIARLYDAKTGKPLKDRKGNIITGIKTFTPENLNGSIQVEIEFNTNLLAGKTFVVYEKIYNENKLVANHCEINDKEQTVYIPILHTKATDKEDGTKLFLASGTQTIVDTVFYKNLYPNEEYTAKASLYDAETGKILKDKDGKIIAGTKVFTPTSADGFVDVEIEFDAELLSGKIVVVYENIYNDKKIVAIHRNLKDKSQTVYVPEISTKATDKLDEDKIFIAFKKQTIVDTVTYNALQPQKEYKAVAQLYNAETGEVIKDKDGNVITGETVFTPETSSGSVEVEIDFDGALLEGVKVVVFEKIYKDDKLVAAHCDLTDEDQTVNVPKFGKLTVSYQEEVNSNIEMKSPKTEDNYGILLFIALVLVGVVVLVFLGWKVRK